MTFLNNSRFLVNLPNYENILLIIEKLEIRKNILLI